MGLSSYLLIVAVCCGLAPLVANGLRPPRSIRDLEKSFVVAMITLAIGTLVARQAVGLGIFGYIHLLYLLVVVTIPLLLGGWWVTAFIHRRRTRIIRLGAVLAVVLALLGVWTTHIEPNWLATDIVAVTAPVQQPLRIGVLSDMQTENIGRHEQNAVDTLIAEQPDLLLVPGDFFQGDRDVIDAAAPTFVELLALLTANIEVVAVVSGDSDRPDQLAAITAAAGAIYIDNQITNLTVNGQNIRLAGVSVFEAPSRLDTIAALTEPSDAFTILLSHRPGVVYDLQPGSDVDLIVAGHTHGGQVSFPLIGPPVTFSEVPRSLAAGGLELVDNYPVYVSTGVGLERLEAPQVRFGVRPSVGIIDVVPA